MCSGTASFPFSTRDFVIKLISSSQIFWSFQLFSLPSERKLVCFVFYFFAIPSVNLGEAVA